MNSILPETNREMYCITYLIYHIFNIHKHTPWKHMRKENGENFDLTPIHIKYKMIDAFVLPIIVHIQRIIL